jgi:hypothetical protein
MPLQRRTRAFGLAFHVQRPRRLQRLGIERDDGVQLRPGAVVSLDAIEAELGQFLGGKRAGRHGGFELGDRGLIEFDGFGWKPASRSPARRSGRKWNQGA